MQSKKHIIVNADDFGLHRSINLAIADGHRRGIVTSASLMPGKAVAPAYNHALELLTDMPALDVGLHFTLVGAPGLPKSHTQFLAAKLQGKFPASRVETLLRQQIDLLQRSKVAISHIDSHQHLHALPAVMRVVAKVAKEYGIRAVRLPRETGAYAGAAKGRQGAAKALALLARISKRELDRAGLIYTDYFFGMAISGSLSPRGLLSLLRQTENGTTEILCHPAADNQVLSKEFDWNYNWEGELAAVTDDEVIAYIKAEQIVLSTFKQMAQVRSL